MGVRYAHTNIVVKDWRKLSQFYQSEGGKQLGKVVSAQYPNNVTATFVYTRDIEGNIIELQS